MRVLYSEFSEVGWVSVARGLRDRLGWEPVLWISGERPREALGAAFPECVFQDRIDAVRLAGPEASEGVVSAALLARLAVYEVQALKMMGRMDNDGQTFTTEQRIDFFHCQVSRWLAVLDRFEPELALFLETPHVIYDFILYAVCRAMGVPTLMFGRTKVERYAYVTPSFEDGPVPIREALTAVEQEFAGADAGTVAASLPEALREEMGRIRGEYAAAVAKGSQKHHAAFARHRRGRGWKHRLATLADRGTLAGEFLRERVQGPRRHRTSYLKSPSAASPRVAISRYEYKLARARGRALRYRNEQAYERCAAAVDLAVPFIYFPMHFQPERTTSPEGGWFVDQRLAVRNLAAVLPEGWRLYLREHPASFLDGAHAGRGHMMRWPEYYEELAALPKVTLAPMEEDSFRLIDRSRAVATVTGTAGWESVVRGRPTLVFGSPWYVACPGVFQAGGGRRELGRLVQRIAAGAVVDEDAVARFLLAVARACRTCWIHPKFGREAFESDGNLAVAGELLASGFERYYGRSAESAAGSEGGDR